MNETYRKLFLLVRNTGLKKVIIFTEALSAASGRTIIEAAYLVNLQMSLPLMAASEK